MYLQSPKLFTLSTINLFTCQLKLIDLTQLKTRNHNSHDAFHLKHTLEWVEFLPWTIVTWQFSFAEQEDTLRVYFYLHRKHPDHLMTMTAVLSGATATVYWIDFCLLLQTWRPVTTPSLFLGLFRVIFGVPPLHVSCAPTLIATLASGPRCSGT